MCFFYIFSWIFRVHLISLDFCPLKSNKIWRHWRDRWQTRPRYSKNQKTNLSIQTLYRNSSLSNRNPIKNGGEIRFSGGVSIFCSTSTIQQNYSCLNTFYFSPLWAKIEFICPMMGSGLGGRVHTWPCNIQKREFSSHITHDKVCQLPAQRWLFILAPPPVNPWF